MKHEESYNQLNLDTLEIKKIHVGFTGHQQITTNIDNARPESPLRPLGAGALARAGDKPMEPQRDVCQNRCQNSQLYTEARR